MYIKKKRKKRQAEKREAWEREPLITRLLPRLAKRVWPYCNYCTVTTRKRKMRGRAASGWGGALTIPLTSDQDHTFLPLALQVTPCKCATDQHLGRQGSGGSFRVDCDLEPPEAHHLPVPGYQFIAAYEVRGE